MNKQKLYDLEIKHKELRQLLERIESVEIYPSTELTGTPRGCMISDKTSVAACVLADYGNQLIKIAEEIERLRNGVDEVICDIVWLRVVDGLTWGGVARRIGKEEEATKKMYYRW